MGLQAILVVTACSLLFPEDRFPANYLPPSCDMNMSRCWSQVEAAVYPRCLLLTTLVSGFFWGLKLGAGITTVREGCVFVANRAPGQSCSFDPRTHLAPQFGDEIVHVQTLGR